MSHSNDREYYAARAAHARALAATAADRRIAAIHEVMADRYEFLAGAGEPDRYLRVANG